MSAAASPGAGPGARAEPALSALQQWPVPLLLRAQGLGPGMKLALFDVDGVLTDGRLQIEAEGERVKTFHVLDGHGLKLLQAHGIRPVIISGRAGPALKRRLDDLGLSEAHTGVADKLTVAEALLARHRVGWAEVAAIGDDWPDLPLLLRAGLSCAPPGAHPEVLGRVHHVTARGGGQGAAREFCDLLLAGAGRYAQALGTALTLDSR